jgi:hypothetical protein
MLRAVPVLALAALDHRVLIAIMVTAWCTTLGRDEHGGRATHLTSVLSSSGAL